MFNNLCRIIYLKGVLSFEYIYCELAAVYVLCFQTSLCVCVYTCQLHSSFDTSVLFLPTVRMYSLGQRSFLMLQRMSGTVSLAKLGPQTHTHKHAQLSNRL